MSSGFAIPIRSSSDQKGPIDPGHEVLLTHHQAIRDTFCSEQEVSTLEVRQLRLVLAYEVRFSVDLSGSAGPLAGLEYRIGQRPHPWKLRLKNFFISRASQTWEVVPKLLLPSPEPYLIEYQFEVEAVHFEHTGCLSFDIEYHPAYCQAFGPELLSPESRLEVIIGPAQSVSRRWCSLQ